MALAFVTLPLVIRAVQPVLREIDQDVEEAAASLGAKGRKVFTTIVLPSLVPAVMSGAGLAFSRCIGEFGSVVTIGGAVPGKTEVSSQWVRALIESDDRPSAAAISIVLLSISFAVLLLLRLFGGRAARREERRVTSMNRCPGLGTSFVIWRRATRGDAGCSGFVVLYRTFRPGFHQFLAWITTPAAISALQFSLLVLVIVIPFNESSA